MRKAMIVLIGPLAVLIGTSVPAAADHTGPSARSVLGGNNIVPWVSGDCVDDNYPEVSLFYDKSVANAGQPTNIKARINSAAWTWNQHQYYCSGGDGKFGQHRVPYLFPTYQQADTDPDNYSGTSFPSCTERKIGPHDPLLGDYNVATVEFKGGDWSNDDIHGITAGCFHDVLFGADFSDMWIVRFNKNLNNYHGSGTPNSNEYDTWSILAHEFGHIIGVGHFLEGDNDACPNPADSNTSRATMCSNTKTAAPPGQTFSRTTRGHDRTAARYPYPAW